MTPAPGPCGAVRRRVGRHRAKRLGGFRQVDGACIHALKQDQRVLRRMLSESRADIALSVITEAELRTGAAKSTSAQRTSKLVQNFLAPLEIVEFTSADAAAYAQVRARLERAGTPIGPLDTLIAAQAVARKLALVSNNERELARVRGLEVENWARAV